MIRRYIFIFLAASLMVRLGYLYFEVGKGIASHTVEAPSIFYGRPAEIRKGDHLGNIQFVERLQRLSYKKVKGMPSAAGMFSAEQQHILIFLRNNESERTSHVSGPVDIVIRDGRVLSLISPAGRELKSIILEPEEIGRITGPKMESRRPITLDGVSPHLQYAVIAAEDARFYSHIGIDVPAMARALFVNIKERRFAQGGSTITQQLAKNFFLSPEKTLLRKLREMELALVLEMRYTKKQILEMYLNKVYWGQDGFQGIYGAEAAANFYFSKRAKELLLEEAALLAGIIHSPNRYYLARNKDAAKERRNAVLTRMQYLDMIGKEDFRKAVNTPAQIRPGKAPVRQASYFIDYIQRITREELGSEKLYQPGYRYFTTLDPVLQAAAQEAVTRGIEAIEKTARPSGEPLQVALVAVDPSTGATVAMIGGRNYGQSRFNRAVDAKRQSGSAFKPFVLLAALAQTAQGKSDKTLSSLVSGEPLSIPTPEGMWSPANFEDKKYGNITIRKTIEDSVNTATTRLANDIGFQEVLAAARQAGITSPLLPVPSMVLGSFEVTPRELAYAYATIASGGIRFEPFALFSVTTAKGDNITSRAVKRKQVIDPRVAYLTGQAMEGVLTRGTAKEAKALGINFPAAGKTGTTNGNRDSWFVGYTSDLVCAVWVGYDSGGDTGLTGAKGALHIWSIFMRSVYPQAGPRALNPPDGIETAIIDPESGGLVTTACPKKFREAYLAGTAPKESCPLHPANNVGDALQKGMRSIGEFFRNIFR
ncbi:MAG: hypothetical protein CVU52_05375 [Deltaproteobacteria bacterium HGW-Deltaproteobacteria-10]|nr:MAG: hypothetical protein CVU52_05375 [Deltaproteobacteria bacterium HGW-Deltaproteobacteria-10]